MRRKKNTSGMPPERVIAPIRELLSDPRFRSQKDIPLDASESDKAKFEISRLVMHYYFEHGLKRKELAAKLGIDEPRVSNILLGRVERFSLDRMVSYGKILYPGLKLKIIAA